jgi:NAD(P)-dependent dehydrogenase (short-subunit alcohol dehydrogenase family)
VTDTARPQARLAWVTGASRGVGRGIAVALGRGGWTVYLTARSTVAGRISAAHGRLDLLVNNAWGGYERLNAGAWEEWNAPLWQQPVELFDAMFAGGVRAHYVALVACAPLLIAAPGSLAVITSVSVAPAGRDQPGAAYAMAKIADDRLALVAAAQLREHRVASVAVHPGWVRTEGVLQFAGQVDLTGSQSPEGVGRAVAALADDPGLLGLTGRALTVTELAERYRLDVTR